MLVVLGNKSFLYDVEGTTEKVFETKKDLFDLYINGGTVKVTNPRLRPVLQQTTGDKLRLQQFISILRFVYMHITRIEIIR